MNYYDILGVSRDADPDAIKRAYRKLASQNHPDKGGSTTEFQKIEEAYRILSDPQQRYQYDHAQQSPFNNHSQNPFDAFGFGFDRHPFEDLLKAHFGYRQQPMYRAEIVVTLEQIARGDKYPVQLNMPSGSKLFNIDIPPAVSDGAVVRYDNLVPDGPIQIRFIQQPHNNFERREMDIVVNHEISILELILGTKIKTTTIWNTEIELSIAPGTKPSSMLRVRGHGLNDRRGRIGDHYVLIVPLMPLDISSNLTQAILDELGK